MIVCYMYIYIERDVMMWKLGIIIGIICDDNIRTYHVCCMLLYHITIFLGINNQQTWTK
jgi:cell shape-determining protein MreD